MNKRKLLVISGYPYKKNITSIFIKERIDSLKKNFNKIFVISPMAFVPKQLNNLIYHSDRPEDYSYDNVEVFFPKYFPLPPLPDFFRRCRLKQGYNSTYIKIKKEKLDFDIIHAHNIGLMGYIGYKLKLKYNKPLVLTGHGGDVYHVPFRNKIWLKKVTNNLEFADKIITVSKRNYNLLVNQLNVLPDKISIIPNGFDPEKFRPIDKKYARMKLGLPLDKKMILSVGALKRIKGQKYLVQAINKIKIFDKNIFCVIIGDGPLKNELKKLIGILDLERHVKLIGSIPHEIVPLWMNACDVFVLPSLDEGNPTVIVESLGCGIPVVATSVGGIPEIIKNNINGYLVKPKNDAILSIKISESLNKDWNSEKIVSYAKKNFRWEKISSDILDVYKSVSK